ncbi:MAG: copper resistance protein B [Gammaproteobacteria bacterium]|nr:copper resistance protein B [Gammaproteobacteria bacterium]
MKIIRHNAWLLAAAFLTPAAVLAQPAVDHSQHGAPAAAPAVDHSQHTAPAAAPAVDHSQHAAPAAAPAVDHSQHSAAAAAPAVDHSQHMAQGAENAAGQSRAGPLPQGDGGRDPHGYSGGYQRGAGLYALEHGHDQLHVVDSHRFGAVIIDQLESVNGDEGESTAYDLQAWMSQGLQRLTLKAEGDIEHSKLEESRTELLWGKALSAYWDTQLGVRHDTGAKPDQSWLAVGVQGLAPYWFEIDATAYLGSGGQTALRLDVEYDLLLTQQLILQPAAELNLYGSNDKARGLGNGLSDATLGVRLRYEFSRQFAPYVGIERTTRFGQTADFARRAGLRARDTRWVAGVRFWF